MKDYGFQEYPEPSFFARYRELIVAVLCDLISIMIIGVMCMFFIVMAPRAIEDLQEHSGEVVALSRGVAE